MSATRSLGLPTCLALALVALCADANAQRARGRGRGRGDAPAPNVPAPEVKDPAKVERWTAIVGGDVYIGDGRLLRGATVLLGDDKVHAVGHDLDIPANATVIKAAGKCVTPGYVSTRGSGMGAPGGASGEIKDAVNPYDPSMKRALAAGVTSFLYTSGSGQGTPSGSSALIKMAFGDLAGMVRAEKNAYSMRVPLAAAEWRRLRELVEQAKAHKAKQDAATAAPAATPPAGGAGASPGQGAPSGPGGPGAGMANANRGPGAPPAGTEELLRILRGEARLWIRLEGGGGGRGGMFGGGGGSADDKDAIRQAMRIAELLGTGVVLDDPVTAWAIADEVAATNSMVLLNPRNVAAPDPTQPDDTGANPAAARILDEAGVPVAVTCPSGLMGGAQMGTGGILGQDLNTPQVDAAYAVRGGMDPRRALRTLTLDAARLAGVERFVGSLEPGKDGDVLILDGDPLSYKTFVETALVNGKVVYQKDQEPFYKHIQR